MFGYGKIHGSFFDSSINDTDPMTRFIFIGMIVLSDRDGRLDITRQALARRMNVSIDNIDAAIAVLTAPDPLSRSKDDEGRRLVPVDPERSWGWNVVNKAQYRDTMSADEKREYEREKKRRQRAAKPGVALMSPTVPDCPALSPSSRHTDTDTDSKTINGASVDNLFAERWRLYPKKDGRKDALRHFVASVRTADDLARFDRALENYIAKIRAENIEPRYIKNGSRFFNNWQDFVDPGIAPAPIVSKQPSPLVLSLMEKPK